MIKFFPELRRRRSDGLASALGIEDYRDPFEIQFGLFGDDDAGGGSDNVDRSNPNEMAARERAAARAGTVTDSSGNPVTSVNPDGSRSVVTTGTQAQQVAAREAFNATDPRASDTRSNYAQAQYDEVAARETAALNRAAEAGRLASASLANVGDITQPAAALGLDDELAFTQGMGTAPVNTGFADAETARVANLTPDEAAAQGVTVAEQRAAQAAVRGQTVNPVTGAFEGTSLIDAFSETDLDPAAGQEAQRARAQQEMDLRAQALSTIQNNLGITSASQATAANVLGTSPSDAGITSLGTTAPASDFLIGQQSSVARPGLVGTAVDGTPITTNEFQSVYVDGRGMSVPRPQMSVINTAAADPMTQLSQQQAIFGLDDTGIFGGTSRPGDDRAARQLSPLEQSVQAAVDASTRTPEQQAGVTPTELMGQQAAAGTPAENFYTDAYRGVYPDVEGNIPGTTMAGIGNAVQEFSPLGMIARGITGADPLDLPSASEQAAFNSGQLLSMGGTMDEQTGAISDVPAGRGTLNMNRFGMVTYSGMPDPSYDGPYANLVNPPADTGGDGGQQMQQATADPCPEGYQMVDGVCTPVDDVTADEPAAPGSNFVINPTTGLPTLFQPTTQATQVGQINPFVLQPYAPQQIRPPVGINPPAQGIQALSPTGAALGRQV